MNEVFQVWVTPPAPIPATVSLGSDLAMRNVTVRPPKAQPFSALLLELRVADRPDDKVDPHFRRIGRLLSRLSLMLLERFHVFSARVVPSGLTRGDVVDEVAFAGEPPGIATTVQWFGFKRNTKFEQTFLTGDIADEVEVAIDWLLTAQASFDPVQQVMCCWIGLEALAPEVAGPWRCPKCGREVAACPHCSETTSGPKAVQAVRKLVCEQLSVSGQEFKALYGLRCRIAHGSVPIDSGGVDRAFKQVGEPKHFSWMPSSSASESKHPSNQFFSLETWRCSQHLGGCSRAPSRWTISMTNRGYSRRTPNHGLQRTPARSRSAGAAETGR